MRSPPAGTGARIQMVFYNLLKNMDFFPAAVDNLTIYFFLFFWPYQGASLNALPCMVLPLPYLQHHESNQMKKVTVSL